MPDMRRFSCLVAVAVMRWRSRWRWRSTSLCLFFALTWASASGPRSCRGCCFCSVLSKDRYLTVSLVFSNPMASETCAQFTCPCSMSCCDVPAGFVTCNPRAVRAILWTSSYVNTRLRYASGMTAAKLRWCCMVNSISDMCEAATGSNARSMS